jgi:hypothetical protein
MLPARNAAPSSARVLFGLACNDALPAPVRAMAAAACRRLVKKKVLMGCSPGDTWVPPIVFYSWVFDLVPNFLT